LAETIQENNKAVISPIALPVAVLQSFKPLWLIPVAIPSGNILNLICAVLHVATDMLLWHQRNLCRNLHQLGTLLRLVPTLLICPVLGKPAGSNAAAGLAVRVTGTHMPIHYGKVEIESERAQV